MKEKITSRIGFGTWQMGGSNYVNGKPMGWGNFDKEEAQKAILEALKEGINFFDTADAYGNGLSETILGETLPEELRDSILICTKFGNTTNTDGQPIQDFSEKWLRQAVENSLKRLKTDYLDILLLHSPPDDFDWENYDTSALDELVQKGKIKSYGVSSKSVFGAKKVLDSHFGSVVEVIYNIFDRRAEKVLFEHENASNYHFIGRVPLASGFLNGRFLNEKPVFSEDDYRYYLPAHELDWRLESIQKLAFLDTLEGGLSTSALRFCISNPSVMVAIPGMRTPQHVIRNKKAELLGGLSPENCRQIEAALPDVPEHWKPRT